MPISVFSLMLVVFSLTTGEFVIVGILPEVADDLHVSISAAGILVTAYALGMIAGGPTVTVATARIGRKRVTTGLVAVSVIANLGSSLAPNYAVLLATRFVAGLVVATFFAVAITTAVSMAPAGRQASTVAKLTLGMNLGIILGTPLGTFVGQNLGWRATFVAIAAVSTVGLLLILRFLPDQPPTSTGSVASELRILLNRDVQLAILLTAAGNVGIITVFTYLAPLLTDVSGFGSGAVPVLLLVYGAGAVVGNFLGGWLADRALMPSLVGLLTVLAAILVVFWAVSGVQVLAVALTFVVGALAFAIIPGMQTHVISTATAAPTLAVAVNASGFQVAAALASWLGGRVIDSNALGLRSISLVGAALTLVGLAIAIFSARRDRVPVNEHALRS
ncbi:MFS transporter [Phytoactinopolyspora halotolerans]|uniref:MFS transporter n=1 Tax=Phytoactinopolyspora halotolerans TaxID=1981512 RepID=A0A6L9SEU3_9ACTN|nr:MFS transporter [Phytoactinopolyspora halotolerans]NEE03935.1 MFS transporter [Phytoactinopolyspora halotolerans]